MKQRRSLNNLGEMLLVRDGTLLANNSRLLRLTDLTSPSWSNVYADALNDHGVLIGEGNSAQLGPRRLLLIPIAITFEPVGDNDNISDNRYPSAWDEAGEIIGWTLMPGYGKRIFPDAKDPEDETPRNTVHVKVHTGAPQGWKVALKVFDVDDPTIEPGFIIDPEDEDGEEGGDNRGDAAVFTEGDVAQIVCTVDADGVAKISGDLPELRVGMQPGDNYRVAATLLKPNGSPMAGQDMSVLQVADKEADGYVPSGDQAPAGFNGVVSPMLTVWRKLHLEIDSMEAVPNPKPEPDRKQFINAEVLGTNEIRAQPSPGLLPISAFYNGGYVTKGSQTDEIDAYTVYGSPPYIGLVRFVLNSSSSGIDNDDSFIAYDDDDKYLAGLGFPDPLPRNDAHADVVNGIQVRFSPAYIEVIDANAKGWNQNQTIPFEVNFEVGVGADSVAQEVHDLFDQDTFWTHQIIFAYQGAPSEDKDPNNEGVALGSTFELTYNKWSAIFLEAHRELEFENLTPSFLENPLAGPTSQKSFRSLLLGTVAHEIGHAPGIGPFEHDEEGLMRADSGYISLPFAPETIVRFRKAARWGWSL